MLDGTKQPSLAADENPPDVLQLGRWFVKVGDVFNPERASEADEVPIDGVVSEQAASRATASKLEMDRCGSHIAEQSHLATLLMSATHPGSHAFANPSG